LPAQAAGLTMCRYLRMARWVLCGGDAGHWGSLANALFPGLQGGVGVVTAGDADLRGKRGAMP
jgi:hypothetical protein